MDSQVAREKTRSALLLTAQLLAILERFAAAKIVVLPLKGPVLSQQLYGDPAKRPSGDIDLLVSKRDVATGLARLAEMGYRPEGGSLWVPLEKLMGLVQEVSLRGENGSLVDLQWDTARNHFPFRIDPEILWEHVETTEIAGRKVPCLDPECLLVFLCMHGAKHMWAERKWISDIAQLFKRGLVWDSAWGVAEQTGCERPVLLGALLARDLYAAELPAEVTKKTKGDRIVQELAEHVKRRLEQSAPAPTGLQLVRFNAKMANSRVAKFRHYAALLQAPTEADARAFRFPTRLFFLYYPFRFFRMIGKYVFAQR